jgi:hypothetical protein
VRAPHVNAMRGAFRLSVTVLEFSEASTSWRSSPLELLAKRVANRTGPVALILSRHPGSGYVVDCASTLQETKQTRAPLPTSVLSSILRP